MKTRTLLILVVSVFSLVSMIVFSAYTGSRIKGKAEVQFDSMISEIAEQQSRNMEFLLESYGRTLNLIAEDLVLNNFVDTYDNYKSGSDEYNENLNAALTEAASYTATESTSQSPGIGVYALAIYDGDLNIILQTSEVFNEVLESPWFSRTEDGVLFVCTGTYQKSSDYHLISTAKLSDKYSLAVIFESSAVKRVFSHSTFPINGRIILIDPNRHLIDDTISMGDIAETSIPEYKKFKEMIVTDQFTTGFERFTYTNGGNNERIAYLTDIGGSGWLVGAFGEAEKAYTFSNKVYAALINCTIFLGLFMLAASIVFVIYFTKPLKTIEETLFSVKRGDHEARVNIRSNNEYGDIARAFNDLMDDVIVSEGRYRTIIEMSDNIIFEWNMQTNQVYFSNNFNKKFSYRAPSDSFEDSFLLKCKVHPEDSNGYKEDLDRLAIGEPLLRNEYRWKNIYGDYIWILMRTSIIRNIDNEIVKVVGVIVDIDRAKRSEKMLTLRASYDALTGLYNRETVESLINNEIELVDIRKNEFAILFIDVDDFKQYNDNYSHATGDQVLQFTASTIQSVVEQFGIAGRFGGDEFVVCVRNSEINDPARVAQEMLDRLKEGFVCDVGDRLSVAVSIGIAVIHNSSLRVDEIIGMADDAMYKIKKSGKSNYGFIMQE